MSFTPFNAPLLSGLLGDVPTVAFFSVKSELDTCIQFEVALARACAEHGLIPGEHADAIATAAAGFEADLRALGAATARDGVIIPELVRQLRDRLPADIRASLHLGATSQDVIDTSLSLRLKGVNAHLMARLDSIQTVIGELESRFGNNTLMARTRMQAAMPMEAHHRLRSWRMPVLALSGELAALTPSLCRLQLGGPVGTRHGFDGHGEAVAASMSIALGLADKPQWHSDRSRLAEYANLIGRICAALGKIGQDVVLMAQEDRREIVLSEGGGSSSMPHKHNPVAAETLVAIGRFAATLEPGMLHAMLHEQERSGAAWMLEWMILPQLCVAAGAATRTALSLLGGVEAIGAPQSE